MIGWTHRFVAVFAIIVGIGLIGCGGGDDEKKSSKNEKSAPPVKPAGAGKTYNLTVRQFCDEHKADRKATEAKYAGAIVEITGTVERAGRTKPDMLC